MKWPTIDEFAQMVADKAIDEIEYNGKTLRQWIEIISATELSTNLAEVGTDCISRQAAIKATWQDTGYTDPFNVMTAIRDRIKQLPPIQSEPHWIPVTEDTPTEDGDYWATFGAETGRFVDWASWYQGGWVTWIEGSPAPLSNVIAWQKSPEPYRRVTE